jgi:O-acetyl-ADP-ribose deacetylase (regulator of RNase III)
VSDQTIESFLGGRVLVVIGDITRQDVTAIVNAANSTLLGGGGVDGAIHRAGGPEIVAECRQIRKTIYPEGLPTGQAVITTGGNLPAKHVIHTVGPIYGREPEREAELLAACYQNSLLLALQHGVSSVAFPSISTENFLSNNQAHPERGQPHRTGASRLFSRAGRARVSRVPRILVDSPTLLPEHDDD